MKIAILGAGLTGLELGRRLKGHKVDFVIFEKESQIGGLCRTNKTGEYYWDFAVHAMYSRNKEIRDYFHSLPLDYEHINRNAKIVHSGKNGKKYFLDYPFESGIKDLPLSDKLDCIRGYIAARIRNKKEHSNLREWVDNNLGAGIARHFMVPYNNKIWNCRLEEISEKLLQSRIEPTSAICFISSVLGKKNVGRPYQAKFIYPKQGIQELVEYTAKDIRENILLNSTVEKLIKYNSKWAIILKNNQKVEADIVISTIPLVELLRKIDIPGIKKEYAVFKWNNTFFVMVALKKGQNFRLIKDYQWIFFKEDEVFYRVTLMHNISSVFLPVLVAEITQKEDMLNKTSDEIENLVVKDVIRLGIIDSEEHIAETDIKLLQYTYTIPTVGLDEVKEKIKQELVKHNIFLLGRSGNWEYLNMDEIIIKTQEFLLERFSGINA